MTFFRLSVLAVIAFPVSLCAQQSDLAAAAATITEADFMRRINVIANDSMQGRDTPSRGLDMTATWIASEFERMGLRGGAEDGGYVQRYPLHSSVVDQDRSYLQAGDTQLAFGADALPLLGDVMSGEATAQLVVVSGSGDSRRAFADGAVRGRHAVLVLGRGAGVDQQAYRTLADLMNAGAASVLVTTSASDAAWSAGATRAMRSEVSRGWVVSEPPNRDFRPVLQLRAGAAEELLRRSGLSLEALQARATSGLRVDQTRRDVTVALRYEEETIGAPNVVAILDGSDPALRDEFVAVSGHMDHVGIGVPNEEGDSIYNGADDNASGTTAVVEIAEAMSSLPTPPRRSMLFLLVSGEEKGLWGSEYFTAHPTVPLDDVVADLNMDMVGRNWPDTIVAIGKEHSDLGSTLERVNADHPELGMTAIDDIWPEESFYTRSDHYNFARRGVPILFFFNGVHEDYHGLDDEPDRINGEKASRIARLVFYLGAELANRTVRPQWNPESYDRIVGPR